MFKINNADERWCWVLDKSTNGDSHLNIWKIKIKKKPTATKKYKKMAF